MENLKALIREVPDFPKQGILFYDITTLLKDAGGLKLVLDSMRASVAGVKIDKVVGIESLETRRGSCCQNLNGAIS